MSLDTTHVVGATSKIIRVKAITISTGLPYTGGAFNTASISATYTRDGSTATTITLVTATAGTYTSSGFVHAGKGVYEIGAPTAALAAGADGVIFSVDGISDVLFSTTRVELVGVDPRSSSAVSANVTQIAGQTASASGTVTFPNATLASTTNITAASGITLAAVTHTGATIPTVTTTGTATNVTTVNGLAANVITAASIATDAITAAKIADGAIDAATFAAGAITASAIAADAIGASELATDAVTEIANAVVEAELTALQTYNRSANTTATITGPVSGSIALGVTVDGAYQPIKTL